MLKLLGSIWLWITLFAGFLALIKSPMPEARWFLIAGGVLGMFAVGKQLK